MRYNENDGDEINGKVVITCDVDENPIFEISCVVVGDLDVETLRANYDLIVIGSVHAEKLDVAGDFSCHGECSCEEIAIQGACLVNGNLNAESGFIGDSLTANEICTESLDVKGTIVCLNMECNDEVVCDKNVLIAEGLTGSGSLSSNMIMCGEYSLLDDTSTIFIADNIETEALPKTYKVVDSKDNELEDIKEKARTFTTQKFASELERFVDKNEKYRREYDAFRKLILVENITVFPSIKTYVDIIDTVNKKFQIITFTKLFGKVKARFESFDYDAVNHSKMTGISQKEFAKMLYVLTYREQCFNSEIRELILDTLYTYAGVDVDVFQKKSQGVTANVKKENIGEKSFNVGDEIYVTNGVWKDTSGIVQQIDINKKTIYIYVNLFGKETPVELAFSECELYQECQKQAVKRIQKDNPPPFKIGDEVYVVSGVWKDTAGVVSRVEEDKSVVTINVDLFGREIPVNVAFSEINKL